jgi:hypothetical protein
MLRQFKKIKKNKLLSLKMLLVTLVLTSFFTHVRARHAP